MKKPICESCRKNESVGVCSVPAVPYSAAYCQECLNADSHPMFILIANTAINGGLEHCADFWKEMVEHSLKHQGETLKWFNIAVENSIREFDKIAEEHDRAIEQMEKDNETI